MSHPLTADKTLGAFLRQARTFLVGLGLALSGRKLLEGGVLLKPTVKHLRVLWSQLETFLSGRVMAVVVLAFVATPLTLLFTNCGEAFKVAELNSLSQSDIDSLSPDAVNLRIGRDLYKTNCSGCHSDVDVSPKRDRMASGILQAIQTTPEMSRLPNLVSLSSLQLDQIARALSSPPLNSVGRGSFTCDPALVPKTPMMKMSNREYRSFLTTLLDEFSTTLKNDTRLVALFDEMPSDILSVGRFTQKEQPFLLTEPMLRSYFEAAFQAGGLIAANNAALTAYPGTAGCLGAATITQACHQTFVRVLAARAFHKPISATEGNALAATLWDTSLSKANLIQLTFTGIVQLPDAMYRVYDQGPTSPRGSRVLTMTPHEVATKLSFFLTGQLPDATLRALADSGQIMTTAVLDQQVERLLTLPGAQDTVRRFFRETYGYNVFTDLTYTPEFLNGQATDGIVNAMIAELDGFFVENVLTRRGTFRDLMTSRTAVVSNANLAQIYGVGASTGPVTLPPERAGFMSRAAFLTRRSGNFTSPVKRGLFVLENVLCRGVGAPPPNAPTAIATEPIPGQLLTTRQRYAHSSEAPNSSCVVCHSRINPLGYVFEQFDSLGRFRTNERIFTTATGPASGVLPVDTAAVTPDVRPGTMFNVRDAADLNAELGNNDRALMCFVENLKTFEARKAAAPADSCQMNSALLALHGSGNGQGAIVQAIKSLVLSEDFKLWSY